MVTLKKTYVVQVVSGVCAGSLSVPRPFFSPMSKIISDLFSVTRKSSGSV